MFIDVTFDPMDRISTLCHEGVAIAKRTGLVPRFEFNGEIITCYAGADPDRMVANYKEALQALH